MLFLGQNAVPGEGSSKFSNVDYFVIAPAENKGNLNSLGPWSVSRTESQDTTQKMTPGDVNNDGILDVFMSSGCWFGNGNNFTFNQSITNYKTAALGDLDNDGDLDAFLAMRTGVNEIWINDGNGFFTNSGQRIGSSDSWKVELGDFDNDGDLDAFVANFGPNKVWLNNGNGTFTDSGQNLENLSTQGLAVADFDGDGDLDVFAANHFGDLCKVWLNDGNGYYTDSGFKNDVEFVKAYDTVAVAAADLDGDNDIDLFLANATKNPNAVYLNSGNGIFTHSGQVIGNNISSHSIVLADMDNDNDLDAIVGNTSEQGSSAANQIWLNNGNAQYSLSDKVFGAKHADAWTTDVEAINLNGDSYPEILSRDAIESLSLYVYNIWVNTFNGDNAPILKKWYLDSDGDGYGDPAVTMNFASQPVGYVADNTDCDDTDSTIHPGANEIAGDGIDQDCDGSDILFSVEQIYLLSPTDNKTMGYGTTMGQVAFSFSKISGASKYILHLKLSDILNNMAFPITVELIPPGSGAYSATPEFSESFLGMVYKLSLDQGTWDTMSLYSIKWGVEAYNDSGALIGSTYEMSAPAKYGNDLKLIASSAITMTSPTPGQELSKVNPAPTFQWDTYQGVSTYTFILAHQGALGFDTIIDKPGLTLNISPMDDLTWQSMPTGGWYWTVLGFDSLGSQRPSDLTIFDFEVKD
jgi:hypothetical protein